MLTRTGKVDLLVFTAVIALLSIGIVMVFSASSVMGINDFRDPYHYVKRQLVWAVIGIILMFVLSRIDYHIYQELALPGVLLSFILLVLVLIIGKDISGSKRWIDLGFFNLQPSEIAKIAMVNFTAVYIVNKRFKLRKFFTGLLPILIILAMKFGLIMLEPDFGTAMAMSFTIIIVIFAGGAHLGQLLLLGIMATPVFYILITTKEYRFRRFMAFLDPWSDPAGTGWNIIQSLLAIGSGGLFGLGLGNSRQKFSYLPEHHTDFIFAILCEELGFIGASIVVILYFVVAWRGIRIALNAPDLYGTLLAIGITSLISFQAMLNIGVVTGSLPVTGITLPFISYGGSSLLISLASVGVLLNISRQIQF
ncbi:MAG: putative lipid II flippase FtsW [Firmicutes bacterium]|nr:putative lipid II flippase FtsW [Bacillota bacterium]